MKRFSILSVLFLLVASVGAENFSDSGGDSSNKPGSCVLRSRGHAQGREHLYSGDTLNGIYGRGYGASAFATANGVSLELQASEDWTAAAQGTKMVVYTTPKQSTMAALVLTVDGAGLQLLSNAAPRTNLTPQVAGTLVWNSADAQLCVSTGTTVTSWVQVSDGSTACSH
jgi:hypothetical protein